MIDVTSYFAFFVYFSSSSYGKMVVLIIPEFPIGILTYVLLSQDPLRRRTQSFYAAKMHINRVLKHSYLEFSHGIQPLDTV
jgi:hypothetical protein